MTIDEIYMPIFKVIETEKIKIMPTYKFEIFINGKLDYTCYTQGQARMYECQLDFEGINYETVRTALF